MAIVIARGRSLTLAVLMGSVIARGRSLTLAVLMSSVRSSGISPDPKTVRTQSGIPVGSDTASAPP